MIAAGIGARGRCGADRCRSRTAARLRRLPGAASRPCERRRARQSARPALAAGGARDLAGERVSALGGGVERCRPSSSTPARCRAGRARTRGTEVALRRYGSAIPAALLSAAVLYLLARVLGTVYTSAKALAIAAPLIVLVMLGGLLGSRPPAASPARRSRSALAAAASSFLILRQAPVAPSDHMAELAQIRPLVDGEKLLFLGRDNFILCELRGSKPFTPRAELLRPVLRRAQPSARGRGSRSSTSTRSPPRRSGVSGTCSPPAPPTPAGRRRAIGWSELTPSYVLWESASAARRSPRRDGRRPARVLGCCGGRAAAGAGRDLRRASRCGAEPSRWSCDDDPRRLAGEHRARPAGRSGSSRSPTTRPGR